MPRFAMLVLALCLGASEGTSLRLRQSLKMKVQKTAELAGETKAATMFFKSWLKAAPKNVTAAKQDAVLNVLEGEVDKIEGNVKAIKAQMHKAKDAHNTTQALAAKMKGKDADMLKSMDEWDERMNKKTEVGALNVLSKLKNAIHLIKKGALAGDKASNDRLQDVLKSMGQMAR